MAAAKETERIIVFIDEENVYRRARDVFDQRDGPVVFGRVDPMAFGKLLTERSPTRLTGERRLKQVRVYTGQPSQVRDHTGYATHRRRVARWEESGCFVHTRPLRYRKSRPPEQKGIDVRLALDAVRMHFLDQLDIAIVATVDTDMVPILETFCELDPPESTEKWLAAEVTAWQGSEKHTRRLNLGGDYPHDATWCHFLTLDDYELVADRRDYSKPLKD